MTTETLILLPYTVYGTPSGNYDGSSDTEFYGNRQKASEYYRRGRGLQTVRFDVIDFQGNIVIQATLDEDPTQNKEWFDVYTMPTDSSAITTIFSQAINGNFTWLRARVSDFVGGTINSVQLIY